MVHVVHPLGAGFLSPGVCCDGSSSPSHPEAAEVEMTVGTGPQGRAQEALEGRGVAHQHVAGRMELTRGLCVCP